MKVLTAFFFSLLIWQSSAQAADYPNHPVRIIVPYAAGGTSDILARLLQPALADATKQSFIVENKSGGASVIGTNVVARSDPDGYTLLVGDTALFVNPSTLKETIPYDTAQAFKGVTMLGRAPLYLLINAKSPFKDLASLIAYAKANPGKLAFSSGGNGSSPHVVGKMFEQAAHVSMLHVPYQNGAQGVQALLRGDVDIYFGGSSAVPQIQAGLLRALAVGGTHRDSLIKEIPTFSELGIAGMDEAYTYWGIFAPAATDPSRIAKLNDYFGYATKQPSYQAALKSRAIENMFNTPEESTEQLHSMIKFWAHVVGNEQTNPSDR